MAKFENRFYLAGVIKSKIKVSTTVNGDKYLWFALAVENKLGVKSTDNNYHQDIGIMIFDKKVIEYTEKVGMKRNDFVVVFGFLSAFKHEVKGEEFTGHGVNATQVFVVKTKEDKKQAKES